MNVTETLTALRLIGMAASHRDGEFRVSIKLSEALIYLGSNTAKAKVEDWAIYETDGDSAVGSGLHLRRWFNANFAPSGGSHPVDAAVTVDSLAERARVEIEAKRLAAARRVVAEANEAALDDPNYVGSRHHY